MPDFNKQMFLDADTAVTGAAAAEDRLPKLLPLQPWHQLLLLCNTPQLKLASRLISIKVADVKTWEILCIWSI